MSTADILHMDSSVFHAELAQKKRAASHREGSAPVLLWIRMERLEILLDALGGQVGLITDGDGELDVVILAEVVQPLQEVLSLVVAVGGDDLGQTINKDMGNVIVAGVQAADEASHGSVVRYIVLAGIHQADLIVDVEAELVALFDPICSSHSIQAD